MNLYEEYSGVQYIISVFPVSLKIQHRKLLGKAPLVVSDTDHKGPT